MNPLIPIIVSAFMILFFQNCAPIHDVQQADPSVNFVTDEEFTPFVREFEFYHKASAAHVPIGFDKLPAGIAGTCYRTRMNGVTIQAYIKIDKEYWPKMSEIQKVNLIFHELGHCVLNRGHVESDSVRLCPTSFMHDSVMSTSCLKDHYDEYIKEMFP